ncbi:MAG: Fe(3+)-pyochelin receptor [Xylophilus sp.]|nr:MAG: Fe(3+)-pyochelin receptor [Xylophilus sp.]
MRGIPQPVSVATRQWMDDRALPDLHAVLQHTPGITVDYIDSERVNYYARGHQIDTLQVDGLTLDQNASASIFIQPDTAMLDRIEILRGAGHPSAAVNLVRKRPAREAGGSAALTLGSWDRRRAEADLSRPLNDAGTVRGRAVAVAEAKGFFQTGRREERRALYGVVEADLGPRTMLTASLQHTEPDASGSWGGLPANADGSQLGLPRSTYLGTSWNRWDRHNDQAFAELAHRLDNGWGLRLSAAHARLRSDGFRQTSFTSASATDPDLVDVSTAIYDGGSSAQTAAALVADGPFTLLGRQHMLTVGAQTLHVKNTGTAGYWGVSPLRGVDLRSWNPYTSYPEPFYTPGNATAYAGTPSQTQQQGIYSTARLSLTGRLTALVGARMGWWRHDEPATASGSYGIARATTPYAGLVYDIGGDPHHRRGQGRRRHQQRQPRPGRPRQHRLLQGGRRQEPQRRLGARSRRLGGSLQGRTVGGGARVQSGAMPHGRRGHFPPGRLRGRRRHGGLPHQSPVRGAAQRQQPARQGVLRQVRPHRHLLHLRRSAQREPHAARQLLSRLHGPLFRFFLNHQQP